MLFAQIKFSQNYSDLQYGNDADGGKVIATQQY